MAEWSNAAVLKTVDLNGSGGSNPSLSAEKWLTGICRPLFLFSIPKNIPVLNFGRKRIWDHQGQRKIPVDLHFIVRLRHKASGAALGLICAVCFDQPAGVFAGCGAVCQAKILASLKIKNGISLTPLN